MVHRMKSDGLKSQRCDGMMVHRTRSNCVSAKRDGGIAGSFNGALWLYAPTGRKGIAQGKAKRRPGIGVPETTQALKGRNQAARKSICNLPRTTAYRPGRAFALPWAISLCPFGAEGGSFIAERPFCPYGPRRSTTCPAASSPDAKSVPCSTAYPSCPNHSSAAHPTVIS